MAVRGRRAEPPGDAPGQGSWPVGHYQVATTVATTGAFVLDSQTGDVTFIQSDLKVPRAVNAFGRGQ